MLLLIRCIGCGESKIIHSNKITLQVILDNKYNYVWSISNGLTHEILCAECSEKIKKHVHAIEDIIGIEIGLLSLSDYSKFKIE